MTDELDHIRDLRPSVSPPSRQLVETERNRLMSIIDRETQHEPSGVSTRRKKRWLVPGAAVAVLATAAAGYALTRGVGTTTEIACPDGSSTLSPATRLPTAPACGASRTGRSPRRWSHTTTSEVASQSSPPMLLSHAIGRRSTLG